MDFFEVVFGRRSTRRFRKDLVKREDIDRMIDAGRYAPTGFNKQPVRFAIVATMEKVDEMFGFTGWLTGKPEPGQRPAAYVVVCNDDSVTEGTTSCDCATYAVMLAAHALGYGSCWHGCRGNDKVKRFLGLPENITPHVAVSLGVPDEEFLLKDPCDEWEVVKDGDGMVRIGKYGREKAIAAEL